MTLIAYAWASGLIEFGNSLPDGALPIIAGQEKEVRDIVEVNARHSRINEQLLVPGVPEADGQHEACDALIKFTRRVKSDYSKIVSKGTKS